MRNGDWLWVYRSLIGDPHLTDADKLIYQSLASFAGMKHIAPSYTLMAIRVNASRRTAIKSIKRLIEVGYVAVEKMGNKRYRTNEYVLLKMPQGCRKCTIRGAGKDTVMVNETTPYKDSIKDIKINNDGGYLNLLKRRGKLNTKIQ